MRLCLGRKKQPCLQGNVRKTIVFMYQHILLSCRLLHHILPFGLRLGDGRVSVYCSLVFSKALREKLLLEVPGYLKYQFWFYLRNSFFNGVPSLALASIKPRTKLCVLFLAANYGMYFSPECFHLQPHLFEGQLCFQQTGFVALMVSGPSGSITIRNYMSSHYMKASKNTIKINAAVILVETV